MFSQGTTTTTPAFKSANTAAMQQPASGPSAPDGQLVMTLCSVAGMLCPTGLPPLSANWA